MKFLPTTPENPYLLGLENQGEYIGTIDIKKGIIYVRTCLLQLADLTQIINAMYTETHVKAFPYGEKSQ